MVWTGRCAEAAVPPVCDGPRWIDAAPVAWLPPLWATLLCDELLAFDGPRWSSATPVRRLLLAAFVPVPAVVVMECDLVALPVDVVVPCCPVCARCLAALAWPVPVVLPLAPV